MQIDGHHTATYVAARVAGFPFDEAEKIAYAAQYVDDATNSGVIQFAQSDSLYSRIASAHKMIDYSNFIDVANHLAWIPFHFLPGNGLLPAGESPEGGEIEKLICRPDSYVARDMLRSAIRDRNTPRGLHRLGIAMHVYADTFAHQGFVGSLSAANEARNLTSGDVNLDARIKAATKKELIVKAKENVAALFQFLWSSITLLVKERKSPLEFIQSFMQKRPVGHAAADVYPDQPYLKWQYFDYQNKLVERDNPVIFLHAMEMMVRAMQCWRSGDLTMNLELQSGLNGRDREVISRLFKETLAIDGEERRQAWLAAIKRGEFSFGSDLPEYVGKGIGSWKESALGTSKSTDSGFERFEYSATFLTSDWKLFHDALQIHRSDVVHKILPRYGICAA
jgi:hypothetical protein